MISVCTNTPENMIIHVHQACVCWCKLGGDVLLLSCRKDYGGKGAVRKSNPEIAAFTTFETSHLRQDFVPSPTSLHGPLVAFHK